MKSVDVDIIVERYHIVYDTEGNEFNKKEKISLCSEKENVVYV